MSSFDDMKRRAEADRAFRTITGLDPKSAAEEPLQGQRDAVAKMLRQLLDRGFNPYVVMEMFIAGAAFLGDNHGVSREQMARALVQLQLHPDRQLIFKPF